MIQRERAVNFYFPAGIDRHVAAIANNIADSAADKNTTALISWRIVAVASSADARPCDKARVVIDDDCNPMLPPSALMTGIKPTSSGYLNNSPL